MVWSATIFGPDESPWEGGGFSLRMTFDERYPEKPPQVRSTSQMFHPNCTELSEDGSSCEAEESKVQLQLAIVGRPNVGKSTLLNTLLQEESVLVGPEAGLTRDSIRAHFEYQGRTIYLVDTTGWLQRRKLEKGAASLSIVQTRKSLMRAHVVALVLDAEEIANSRRSVKHDEVVIARQAIEEGRGLLVAVNKIPSFHGQGFELCVLHPEISEIFCKICVQGD